MTTTNQILFIDSRVADISTLLASVDPAIEVVQLSADTDGLAQIAQALAGRGGIEAVHIVSHGAPGELLLGASTINLGSLAGHADELAAIHDALAVGADLLLYGCNVAEGDVGQAFITALAGATGADVAASTDSTGLGGNWALEASTGPIEAAAITAPDMATTLAVAASGIFDNGYIKFGYSGAGTFGYGSNQTPGIFYDSTGKHSYAANADYLTPGSPWEYFAVKIGGSTYVNNNASYSSPVMATTVDTSGIVHSGANTYGSITFTSIAGGLKITQTYTLGATDQVISIKVSVQNTSTSTVYGVKYARGIDPDVDSPLGTTSTQNVRGATDISASDIVLGTGPISHRVIGLYTNSSLTHNTSVSPYWSTDPATLLSGSGNDNSDSTINLAFDLGDLAAGQTKEFSLAYVFAANAAALAGSIAQVPASNPAPTMTGFGAPVVTSLEDTVVALSFADLMAKAGASDLNADGTPGTISAFVIKGIASGTLKIGTSPATATAWVASSNDSIAAGQSLYWTPAADANGILNAFQIAARDAQGAVSAVKTVKVDVTPVNDAPHLSPGNVILPAIDEDPAVNRGASVDSMFAPRFSDVDGDHLGGIVISGNAATSDQGQWQYSTDGGTTWHDIGNVSASAGLVLSATSLVRFAPAADWNGKPGSLTVHAVDSTETSYTSGSTRVTLPTDGSAPSSVSPEARDIETSVTPVNDPPVFDDPSPIIHTLTETAGWDDAQPNALTGTIFASDPADGDPVTYGIRGGVAGTGADAGTIVRQGTYGKLVIDVASGAWHYDITNPVAYNALAAGATGTETFEFVASDGHGGQAIRTFSVTLTGANDTPELANSLSDITLSAPSTWSYQIPSNTITDAEGLGLTYSISLLDGNGNPVLDGDGQPIVLDANGGHYNLANGAWVAFDAASRTIFGTTNGAADAQTLEFQVTASDSAAASASGSFKITLEPVVSAAPPVRPDLAPVTTDVAITIAPDSQVTLSLGNFGFYGDDTTTEPAQVMVMTPGANLTLNGIPVFPGQPISAADIKAGNLVYTNLGLPFDTFLFQVSDGTNWSTPHILQLGSAPPPLPSGAPTLSVSGAAAYTENARPVALAPAIALTSDSGQISQAKVQITGGALAEDRLAFTANLARFGDMVASYDATTHTLTLTSTTASLAQWRDALRSVTFSSDSDDPGANRTITWTVVNSSSLSSAPISTSIAITQVNDAPTVSYLANPPAVTPGADWSFDTGNVFSDPEGGPITYSATLADGTALPSWLQFDAATHTFSGNPPPGTPYLDIKLVGTDDQGATAFTTFTVQLADASRGATAANNPGSVAITGTARQGSVLSVDQLLDTDGHSGPVSYQWQASLDGGATWVDIAGATGTSFTLGKEQVGAQVRVQAFYNDDGGSYETPVSTALGPIANVQDAGTGIISGTLAQGNTLVASISDADGLTHATPTYQWFRTVGGVPHAIDGATYSAYTLTPADGGASISVVVSYVDDKGGAESFTLFKSGIVDLAATPPVAADDTAYAVEAGGVDNGTPGIDPSGNLFANDNDVNTGKVGLHVVGLHAGGTLGMGAPATTAASGPYAGWLQLAGNYGTLYVNAATGDYHYEVQQDNPTVQALLSASTTVTDVFNYTVADPTELTDSARLTITIAGQNDAATVGGFVDSASAIEDVPTRLPLSSLAIDDPDGGTMTLRLHVDAGTLSAVSTDPGVVITGSNTGTLTISAGTPFALSGWLRDNGVFFTSAPHSTTTSTLSYALDDGSGFVTLPQTMTITTSEDNDAPIVDLSPAADGNDAEVIFRPRGDAVQVAPNVVILSGDPAEDSQLLSCATVAIASGADDNVFGTIYETLSTTHDGLSFYFADTGHTITLSGNGTPTITLSGDATRAEYETALRSIVYDNANPNAAAGDRTVTVSVTDDAGQVSNAASFALAAANPAVEVGHRIFVVIDGVEVDTGVEVAEVSAGHRHFVASAPIPLLPAGATINFHGANNALITSGTQSGPLVATVTVHVPWTPVIDLNGDDADGRDHTVTYTEGQAGVAIATPDASITDQDGNIASVVVTLTNPLDGAAETLTISGAVLAYLGARGVTVAGNGSHTITLGYDAVRFPGGLDATDFQIALRGIQYANASDNPEVATQRVVSVTSTDMAGFTGVDAQTLINVRNVNDAPVGQDNTLTIAEDTARVLAVSDFPFTDAEGNSLLAVKVVGLPAAGSLTLDGVAVTVGQFISRADIEAGKLVFTPAQDAHGIGQDSFQFQLQDNGGTDLGGVDLDPTAHTLRFDVTPVNDAPVLTAGAPQLASITEDQINNAGQRVGDLFGTGPGRTGFYDVDTAPAGESHDPGIAIYALNNGDNGSGTWQYSLDGGTTWHAVGTVDAAHALLLGANDRIRFVPDQENGTSASFSYYLWDGATTEVHGQRADASVRGGTSAFSEGSDTATIVVTPVNDAPTIDLGTSQTFRPRGGEVAIVGSDFHISDVDHAADGSPDLLVSASVAISGGAADNLFTTYETLRPVGGGVFTGADGHTITISGNGTGANGLVGATALTLSGLATRAEYEAALASIRYNDANPNATRGDRTLTITVKDASVTTGNTADGLQATATATVHVPWTPVVDLNGDAAPGRDFAVTFTERTAGVAIAASNASIVDQDGNIQTVTITLANPLDGSAERLFISPAMLTQIAARGITITVAADGHSIVLSGNKDGTTFQFALRAVQYVNTSNHPDATARVVNVTSVDMDGNVGVGATTTINLATVNDAPEGVDGSVTLDEDTVYTFGVADFGYTDVEGHGLASVIIATLPAAGALTLNGVPVTAGQEVSAADIAAGLLRYEPAHNANKVQNPVPSFTFQVRDAGGTANGGIDLDATPNTLELDITPVNDLPTGSDGTGTPSVTVTGELRDGQTLTANFDIADVDRTASEIAAATSYQWQVRTVPNGSWTNIAGATGSLHLLTGADVNLEIRVIVGYQDTPDSSFAYSSDVAARPAIVGDADGNITLTLNTDDPVLIVDPLGNVTVTNEGHGPLTVDGMPDDGTLTVHNDGPTTVTNPKGDLTLINEGTGPVTAEGVNDSATVTTGGTGPITIADPEGDLSLDNTGTGPVTVSGLNDDATLTTTGSGNTTVADPDGDLVIINNGTGTVTAEGVHDGATVTTGGTGPITIADPEGDLTLANNGTGPVTVSGLNDDATLTTTGSGITTVANPDGDLSLVNNGSGYVIVTGLHADATLSTAGTGDVFVRDPAGDLNLVNNQHDGGDLFVDGVNDGASVTLSGSGPTRLTNPDGDLTVVNDSTGQVTVRCVKDGHTVTTSGNGDVTIDRPRGDLRVVNQGPGDITVDGMPSGKTVSISGEGLTTVSNPDGDIHIHNDGLALVRVTGVNDGATLQVSGDAPTTVAHPVGDITIDNAGHGTITTTGVGSGATVTYLGVGPEVLDLSNLGAENDISVNNRGGAPVDIQHLGDGVTLNVLGGDVTLSSPEGRVLVENDGTGTVHVNTPADGSWLIADGAGPFDVSHPAGDFTLDNRGEGTVTVRGMQPGSTLNLLGDGLVKVVSNLAAGEHVTVDVTGNSNVQLDVQGEGVIDLIGDLALNNHDDMRITLHGNGTTAITVTGGIDLGGTLLHLNLAAGYNPALHDSITLLANDGTDAVIGHFAGLPEGATLLLDNELFQISYAGGDGNDVVLTRVNANPAGLVTVTGIARQGETLTASHSLSDTDGMGAVTYRWMAGSEVLAVGDSYVLGQEAVGKAIKLVATYTDGEGTTETVESALTGAVANVNDDPTGAVTITGTAALGRTLIASNTLADLDGMGPVSYQWQRDGQDIANATGNSYELGLDDIGKTISVIARYVDGYGHAEQVSATPTTIVTDGNGVPSSVESQVPGLGPNGTVGDGNGDGVPDALQPAVASALLARAGGAPSSYATLVVDSQDGKVRAGSMDRITDLHGEASPANLPSWAQLPVGAIGFSAQVQAADGIGHFSLYVDKDLGINGFWAPNAQGVLVNLASEAYGGRMVIEGGKLRLDFQIQDGGEFDHSAAGDHQIVSNGAAGHAELGLIGYVADTPITQGGSLWD